MKVLMFIFGIFLIPSVFASPVIGPIKPDVLLPFYPELNPVANTLRVPVVVGSARGVAEVGELGFIGRVGSKIASKTLGGPLLAAVGVADLSYEAYKWYHETSTVGPMDIGTCFGPLAVGGYEENVPVSTCVSDIISNLTTIQKVWPMSNPQISLSSIDSSNSLDVKIYINDIYTNVYYGQQGGLYTFRWVKTGTIQMTTINKAEITPQSAFDILASQLLNMPSNNVFNKPDGTPDPDYFSDSDTTFDPTASPNNIPMTLDELSKYVDWIRSGKAQTTDPLSPYYISPFNYQYTQNYINNIDNSVTSNTSGAVAPQQTTSSSALTQSQYDASNKKTDDKLNTDIAAIPQPAVTGLLTPIDDFTTSVNDIKTAQVPTINKPSSISYGSGTCWSPTIDSFNGTKISAGVYCDNYSQIAHPILYWSIWAGTFIYLWHFGRQTLSARV